MSSLIEIHWTCGNIDEARKISRHLVNERLVACAQITPWIESIYLWNNQLETAQESKITLKSELAQYDEIKETIEKLCTYEVPEITYTIIDGGNENYLNWAAESVKK